MRRVSISRIAAVAIVAAGAAACSSPTFSATGQFSSNQLPACVYCSGGGGRDYIPPFLTDQSTSVPQDQSQATIDAH